MASHRHPRRSALAALLFAAAIVPAPCLAEGIRTEPITIPVLIAGPSGRQTITLEGVVVRPDDGRPHPLAIINHGSPRDGADRPAMNPYGMWPQAMAFARRGWTSVAFMRRGYGRSGGERTEGYGSCRDPDYVKAGRAGADDIARVAAFMETQPFVAKGKWISVGVSAGAFATVALTGEAPSGLAAAIAFEPGRGSTSADKVCDKRRLVDAFAAFGRTSRTPLLWVNAGNDHFFGPALVAELVGAFSTAGGMVDHVETPAFGSDGHSLFSAKGEPVWAPIVDRFLAAHRLALRTRLIEVALPDARPPSGLGARGKEAFAAYRAGSPNKAFAIGDDGHFGWAAGRRTPADGRRDAMGFRAANTAHCAIVDVNDEPAR